MSVSPYNSRDTYFPYMDLMRYALALGVLIAHYNGLAGHSIKYFISSYDCVGAFFALSGFLVYPSYEKVLNLRKYCINRARRILPPYFFIVILCAVGLCFTSTLSWWDYFMSSGFWQYLVANLCFLNFLHPELPGVFVGNEYAVSAVNGSLWTMKVEWCLYLSVPLVIWFIRRFNLNRRKVVISIVLLSVLYRLGLILVFEQTGREIYHILSRQFMGQMSYFYVGVMIYFYKDKFQSHLPVMLCLGAILLLLAHYLPYGYVFLSPVAVGVMVMAISVINKTPDILRHKHNVSYEIYLFHAPLIQLLIFTGLNGLPVFWSFSILIVTTVGLSAFCHYFVCLPFLKKKRHYR